MKKYTQEEFDDFEVVGGERQCPSGDYSNIKNFDCCSFGKHCSFGECCSFGEYCSFGERCRLGEYCSFGELCVFGDYCRFGELCSFGEQCTFGEHCTVEDGHEFTDFFKVEGLGSEKRCTYFFKLTDNSIFVRCGCFSGTLQEFRDKVKETHKDTKFAKEYLIIADFVEMHFQEGDQ